MSYVIIATFQDSLFISGLASSTSNKKEALEFENKGIAYDFMQIIAENDRAFKIDKWRVEK